VLTVDLAGGQLDRHQRGVPHLALEVPRLDQFAVVVGEDHFAWLRWLTACADTLGVPLGELPAAHWHASGTNQGRCACQRCAPRV
jgi:hypothetical protein